MRHAIKAWTRSSTARSCAWSLAFLLRKARCRQAFWGPSRNLRRLVSSPSSRLRGEGLLKEKGRHGERSGLSPHVGLLGQRELRHPLEAGEYNVPAPRFTGVPTTVVNQVELPTRERLQQCLARAEMAGCRPLWPSIIPHPAPDLAALTGTYAAALSVTFPLALKTLCTPTWL